MFKRRYIPFTVDKDNKIKVITDRINSTEKFFEELSLTYTGIARKLCGYRDKHDLLAKIFQNYSEEEGINQSLTNGFKNFTKALTILGDCMDIQIQRIEIKILSEIGQYESVCKVTKENLRSAVISREKELSRQKQLMDIKTKFSVNSSAADSELVKANAELDRTQKRIDEICFDFEKQKITNLKKMLLDYVQIQMKMHSRALEILSATYYDIANINETKDLQDFKKLFKSDISLNSETRAKSLEHLTILKPKHKSLGQSNKDLSTTLSDTEDVTVTESSDKSSSIAEDSDVSDDEDMELKILKNRQSFITK